MWVERVGEKDRVHILVDKSRQVGRNKKNGDETETEIGNNRIRYKDGLRVAGRDDKGKREK